MNKEQKKCPFLLVGIQPARIPGNPPVLLLADCLGDKCALWSNYNLRDTGIGTELKPGCGLVRY